MYTPARKSPKRRLAFFDVVNRLGAGLPRSQFFIRSAKRNAPQAIITGMSV